MRVGCTHIAPILGIDETCELLSEPSAICKEEGCAVCVDSTPECRHEALPPRIGALYTLRIRRRADLYLIPLASGGLHNRYLSVSIQGFTVPLPRKAADEIGNSPEGLDRGGKGDTLELT